MGEAMPIAKVQAAKAKLAERCAGRPWFRGVGIAPAKEEGLFTLRLNVDPRAKGVEEIPTELDGVPVEVVFLSAYKPRSPDR
jgi:hypothetical protein